MSGARPLAILIASLAVGLLSGCGPKRIRTNATPGHDQIVLLHELSHAVHGHLIGHDNPAVLAAYKQAMDRGLYDKVKHESGGVAKAYAGRSTIQAGSWGICTAFRTRPRSANPMEMLPSDDRSSRSFRASSSSVSSRV